MDLKPGDNIGEHTLQAPLGAGGFGVVWKAVHSTLGGDSVAIKIPTDPLYADSLKQEAVFQHDLTHPNIVKILGLVTQSDPVHVVMEYIDGLSLEDYLDLSASPLSIDRTLGIYIEVLRGIAYAHSKGFMHRDIKPSNILLSFKGPHSDGEIESVKVCDFGLGRPVEHDEIALSTDSKKSKTVIGTLEYMSPEQMSGNEADERSDIYSLGRILFRMLAGRLPTGVDESLMEYIDDRRAEDLEKIYKHCCARLDRRYSNAGELLDEIKLVSAPLQIAGASTGEEGRAENEAAPADSGGTSDIKPSPIALISYAVVYGGLGVLIGGIAGLAVPFIGTAIGAIAGAVIMSSIGIKQVDENPARANRIIFGCLIVLMVIIGLVTALYFVLRRV